jgi:hypothetical protein
MTITIEIPALGDAVVITPPDNLDEYKLEEHPGE